MLAIAGRRLSAGWHGDGQHRRCVQRGIRRAGPAMASIAAPSNVGSGELARRWPASPLRPTWDQASCLASESWWKLFEKLSCQRNLCQHWLWRSDFVYTLAEKSYLMRRRDAFRATDQFACFIQKEKPYERDPEPGLYHRCWFVRHRRLQGAAGPRYPL